MLSSRGTTREGRARAEPARRRVDSRFNMAMEMVEEEVWIASKTESKEIVIERWVEEGNG